MSEATERLLVRIDATTEQLRREMKKADDVVAGSSTKINRSIDAIKKSFSGLGLIIGAAGIGLAFRKIISATAEQERVTAQLNAALLSTGGAAGKTAGELTATAASLQKVTRFGDEAIIGMQSLLLTFKDIKGDNFDRTTKAVLDMSTAMGQDLKSSAIQLGKALNDPITGLSALSRVGVTFTESQKETIKVLAETGQVAEAQILILQELETEFGGSAEAARNTLGGALEGLSHTFNDLFEAQSAALGPMKDSINELNETLADPQTQANAAAIVQALIDITAHSVSAINGLVEVGRALGETFAIAFNGINQLDVQQIEGEIAKIKGILSEDAGILEFGERIRFFGPDGLVSFEGADELKQKLAELEEGLKKAKKFQTEFGVATYDTVASLVAEKKALGETAEATTTLGKSKKEYAKLLKATQSAQKKSTAQHEKNIKLFEKSNEALDDMVRAGEAYIEQQEFEIALIKMSAKEQAVANAVRSAGTQITEEMRLRIKANAAALYDAESATQAATAAQKPFQDALQGTIERIDSAFADAWRGAFDSFTGFADGIKEAFKELLAELAHMAITRPIVMGISGAFGLGGSAAAGAAGTTGSGLLSGGLSSLPAAFSSGISSSLQSLAGTFESWGFDSGAYYVTGYENALAQAGNGSVALGSLYTAGAGLAGSYASNQAFGETSGVGSTVGTVAGTYIGGLYGNPVAGAALGSFLGGGAERLLGNVLGFGGSKGDDPGRSEFDLGTGEINSFGLGKKFDQRNVDAAGAITQVLKAFSDAIGGSDFAGQVTVGNSRGLNLDGEKFKEVEDLLAAAFIKIADASGNLSAHIKKLIKAFDGTADEIVVFAQALVSIDKLIQDNPVDKAIRDFADAQELAGMRITDVYKAQIEALNGLILGYDGSIESTVNLNTALAINKQLAYDMALALQAIGESTKSVVRGEIDYFNEAVRTPDESLQYMQKQLEFLDALLPKLTDPDQIVAARDKALELNRSVFDAGPEDLQRSNVDTFIDFARHIEEATNIALANATDGLQVSQEDLNASVGAMLELSAQGFQASADRMYSASEMMFLAVQNFLNNSSGQYVEITS